MLLSVESLALVARNVRGCDCGCGCDLLLLSAGAGIGLDIITGR